MYFGFGLEWEDVDEGGGGRFASFGTSLSESINDTKNSKRLEDRDSKYHKSGGHTIQCKEQRFAK